MKIERINDRQIRCTLTREDLAKRGLRMSEFAYGTKKARALFQEMMEQASQDVGFEADDCPLMIEAVPMGAECLVLIVTQVDDPEELDTRFSSFGPAMDMDDAEGEDDFEFDGDMEEAENDFSRMLKGVLENHDFSSLSNRFEAKLIPAGVRPLPGRVPLQREPGKYEPPAIRIFIFDSLHELRHAASVADSSLSVKNALYRDSDTKKYYLCLEQPRGRKKDAEASFVAVCTMLAEYGQAAPAGTCSREYLAEHCEVILKDNALKQLASL